MNTSSATARPGTGPFFFASMLPVPVRHLAGTTQSVLLAISVSAATACGRGVPPGPVSTVRDSAGVTIIENAGEFPDGAGGWVVSPEPVLQIGVAEGDETYELFGVRGAARLSDGRIAVVNAGIPDIRIFDPAGRHLRTLGRRGEGPEEFMAPALAGVLPGDTLVVVDRRLHRLNLYHPEEGFIRSATADPATGASLDNKGMFASGAVLVTRAHRDESQPEFDRTVVTYLSMGLGGGVEHDFGEFPGDETLLASQRIGGLTSAIIGESMFGKHNVEAVAGDRFFYGSQDSYEIQVRSQNGALIRIIRRDLAPLAVVDAHVASFLDSRGPAEPGTPFAEFERMLRDGPVPDYHPAYGRIHADVVGCLWVEEYRLPGADAKVMTVFDPDGRMAGSVVLPDGLEIEEIGTDYILGRYRDDLGVEYVRIHELVRSR